MSGVPTTYLVVGGVAVSGAVVYYMYTKDEKFFFNGKPGFTFGKWLKWQVMPVYRNSSPGPTDWDNISKEDQAIIDRQFSVPPSSATIRPSSGY